MVTLKAPFPWFGGKSRAAGLIWGALGNPPNYVEPFAGSLATLLARPHFTGQTETVNDRDGFLSNFWRAVAADPDGVAEACDWPVNEADLHARHLWLVGRREELTARLMGDPDFYDVKVAGWWVWGICQWIGPGWCSGDGPWQNVDGKLTHVGNAGRGVHRQIIHVGNAGMGVHRQIIHVGDAGMGVHRQIIHVGDAGMGELAARLRRVRVCCGDWTRVLGPSVTYGHGITGVLLDPPYPTTVHAGETYGVDDTEALWDAVVDWCEQEGDHPDLRIVLCGYDGLRAPKGWAVQRWKAKGGYGSQGRGRGRENSGKETLWLSPACLRAADLFATGTEG